MTLYKDYMAKWVNRIVIIQISFQRTFIILLVNGFFHRVVIRNRHSPLWGIRKQIECEPLPGLW